MTIYRNALINRRSVLKGTAAGATILAAPGIIGPAIAAEENVVYVNTWGGSWTNAEDVSYFKPFTKETGIEVKTVAPVSFAKVKSQVQSGTYEFDVSNFGIVELEQARVENLIEPFDRSIIDRSKLAMGNFSGDAVPSVVLGYCMAYRKDKFPNGGPKSWADFWDMKKFPGNRGLYNRSFTDLAYALLADGVALDKVYPMDIERAFKKMNEIKPYIKVWWEQTTQSQQLLRDGEVDMLPMANARAQELIDQGVPVEIVWNGTENTTSYYFVVKGTPRAKAAMKFIEFTYRAEPQANFCKLLNYGPSNPEAFKHIDAATTAKMPSAPDHAKVSFYPDGVWLAPNLAALRERWTQWLAT